MKSLSLSVNIKGRASVAKHMQIAAHRNTSAPQFLGAALVKTKEAEPHVCFLILLPPGDIFVALG
jgi:hypothetical protein